MNFMKRTFFLCGWLAFSTLIPCALAATGKLNQAVALFNQGQPQAARTVLATIGTNDAGYGIAKCYDALCLYSLTNKLGFLKTLKSPAVQGAIIPNALVEDLEFKQIDALFYYRKFEELLPKIAEFQASHENSPRLPAVAEYQLAALYERGMKKVYEASILGDGDGFASRWLDGQSNLVDFLNLAVTLNQTNYQTLPNRKLPQEIVRALTALGNDKAVELVPAVDKEATTFASLELYRKLQPKAVDDNLQRMTNFLNSFPKTVNHKRVLFAMADISFSKGEALSKAAEAATLAGDSQTAAADHAQAEIYFGYTRSLQNALAVDATAGIDAANVFNRQTDLLHTYCMERDYVKVVALAQTLATNSVPGSLTWRMAKVYWGMGLDVANPPDWRGAAAQLDAVLAGGFNGNVYHDHWTLSAAEWRMAVARHLGETNKLAAIVEWVAGSTNCVKNQQMVFLKRFAPGNAK